jgi:2-keto-4-pentenoate hydratase
MTTAATAVDDAVARLDEAAISRRACPPVRDLLGTEDIASAYRVQTELLARRTARGAVRVGRKIGLTSPAVQRQLGVDRPDFGVLFDEMAVQANGVASMRTLLQPKVEGEVAVRLGADLTGELDRDRIRAAVAGVSASVEIVDSRIAGWDISITDTVADNASSGLYVVGPERLALSELEPRDVDMTLSINGEVRSSGNGAACLGDPLEALRWLAVQCHRFGDPLRAGQVVLSGALGPFVPFAPGDRVEASITGFAPLVVEFLE